MSDPRTFADAVLDQLAPLLDRACQNHPDLEAMAGILNAWAALSPSWHYSRAHPEASPAELRRVFDEHLVATLGGLQ